MNQIPEIVRKTVLYIAMSLDGYIAKPNDDLSFLSIVEVEGEDYGYYNFEKTVDTIIMGRKTYDWLMTQVDEFPHLDKTSYIITRTARSSNHKNLIFYNNDLIDLIHQLSKEQGRTIFIDGGAQIVNSLLEAELIDEMIISVIPIILGCGTRLFQEVYPEQKLQLIKSEAFKSGLVQLHYSTVI